jgi:hypothetical protein
MLGVVNDLPTYCNSTWYSGKRTASDNASIDGNSVLKNYTLLTKMRTKMVLSISIAGAKESSVMYCLK